MNRLIKDDIELKEITEKTLIDFIKLKVSDNQKNFVAPNEISVAQAHFSEYAWFRGIYHKDTPVGFVMLHIDKEKPEYYLWRYMIGADFQGKGYGKVALEIIIDYVKSLPKAKELTCSYVPGEGSPWEFYKKLGFEETGEVEEGENVIKLTL